VALRDVRRMYSNIREMDAQIGKVLAELEEDGLLDSTIIFWYGDHGGPLPRQKRLCYDSGLRAPLIIRYPEQWRAGQIDSQLISFVDFLPTLLSMAGAQAPTHLDGRAFTGKYATSPERTYIHGGGDRFDEKYDMIRAVRDRKYKYLRNFQPDKPYYLAVGYREQMPIMKELLRLKEAQGLNEIQSQWFRPTKDPEELFDTENDPHELNNLAALPEYESKLAELRSECDRWMKAIDDKGLVNEKEYIRSIWNGDQQPRTSDPVINRTDIIVSLSCETEGASIGYKILASTDTSKSWQVYRKPFTLPPGNKVEVLAHRIGYLPSNLIAE
jgi:arylsulfatase A-like enzyme